jgi:tetratricopeptide (TPR) repeat protein
MKKITLSSIVLCLLTQLVLAERPMNELPMYGGQHNPTVGRNVVFSRNATRFGWKAYYQGDFDTAIKRFNQGWMFDRENPEVYWGFGLIMGQRASKEAPEQCLKESIRFLQMATEKDSRDGRIIGDLAFSHTLLGHFYKSDKNNQAKAEKHFNTAATLFRKAFEINPEYPPIVANWSVFYFYTEEYQKAKSKADEAIKMGYKFSPGYIRDLKKKLKSSLSSQPMLQFPRSEM